MAIDVATAGLVAIVAGLSAWPSPVPARQLPPGVTRTRSGLVMADPLDEAAPIRQLTDSYDLGGSTGAALGWARDTKLGLEVGIKAHSGWAGWFAATIHAAGPEVAWHTVMCPAPVPAGGRAIAVFAVQTATTQSNGEINYVVVAAVSRADETYWLVGYAHGLVADAATKVLWKSAPQHLGCGSAVPGRALTLVTDGRHSLSVWVGSTKVFSNSRLRLDIPAPFQAYLEVQSSAPAYYARFADFWVADDTPLRVEGMAPGSRLDLSFPGGGLPRPALEATAGQDGAAALSLPAPELVGTATLTLLPPSSARTATARRIGPVPYAGGDVLELLRA